MGRLKCGGCEYGIEMNKFQIQFLHFSHCPLDSHLAATSAAVATFEPNAVRGSFLFRL